MKKNSFITFKDNHIEEIVYSKELRNGEFIFSTESGIYYYIPLPYGDSIFRKLVFDDYHGNTVFCDTVAIKSIVLDKRKTYKFTITKDNIKIDGKILANPNDEKDTIKKLIMDELDIKINLCEPY